MKKSPLILLLAPLATMCFSCAREAEYAKFIKKLQSYYGRITFQYYEEDDGDRLDNGFYKCEDGVITLFETMIADGDIYEAEIRLPYQNDAPNNFYCTFTCTHNEPEETVGRYLISNYHTYNRAITFYEYEGPERYQEVAESIATDRVSSLLFALDYWVDRNYPINLRKIGLFPVFDL